MTFLQARNHIISGLEAHIGCPVVLSEQISEIPEFPYCYYSVLTPRASNYYFGLQETKVVPDGVLRTRTEQVAATLSFTFCGMNRETDDGYIFGEDEALTLSEKAHGFFLLNAHNIPTEYGDVVVNNVGSAANRSGFSVEDTIRRYGFDVRFSYVRIDEMPTTTVEIPGSTIGAAHL
jgi:hypothetical protein